MKNRNYWLMKSEPEEFSIDDLRKNKKTLWTGVRNYQARNFMVQSMKKGDGVLFYHSNAQPSGIAGLARVSEVGLVDPTQFDSKSDYYDPKSTPGAPRWFCAEIEYESHFKRFLSLDDLRKCKEIENLILFKKGQRLSIQPLNALEFEFIKKMGN